ncbi:MAG: Transcriptional regulatory protein CssR [candidate division WS2 bacterium]|uniref:Transcriptional regulatory protein CssR n=1 Tax=Psychracetigena formicireducens TaxID=2986056 RepID=A0A9E2BIV2_PSYF1|nr:Transcriptional regulatory protein CssR [Candidatus Psychracetigena formicireducens]
MAKEVFSIFAVEDDPVFSRMLKYVLELDPEHLVRMFAKGSDLIEALHDKPSLITIDYSLPDIQGDQLLSKIKAQVSDVPVVVKVRSL